MAINKVEYGGNTLIDLTGDSVTPETLVKGVTAHDKTGKKITGTAKAEDIINQANIPVYIKTAVFEVAKKVEQVRKSDSIVFMAMSDSHYNGEQTHPDAATAKIYNTSNHHACMAAKILSYALKLDFNCHLGDVTFGHGTTTTENLKQQIAEFSSYLDEAYKGVPQFRCVGNHDTGQYNKAEHGSVNTALVGKEYLFSAIGKYCEGATYGSTEYGYCYRDFTEKKLRVICLNSSEGETLYGDDTSYAMSPTQLKWFAQTLYDVGSKSDASAWSIIVLSHFPLDFHAYSMYNSAAIVKAYVEGASTTQNGTTINFNGHNGAKFVANIHGHVHCFKVDKIHTISNGTGAKFDAWRVCTPSTHYALSEKNYSNSGIVWNEDTVYNKVRDTYQDTSFVINVVNPSEQKIYSFCYGAGYDRVIGYAATVYYSIANTLSNVTTSNTAVSWEENQSYTATLTAKDGYILDTVKVTMGDTDITSSVYSNGVINIPKVTGNITIGASAIIETKYTNWLPKATSTYNGTTIYGDDYNGDGKPDGYKTNTYISGGNVSDGYKHCTTGFIPVKYKSVIRLRNVVYNKSVANYNYQRMSFYKADGSHIGVSAFNSMSGVYAATYENNDSTNGNVTSFTLNSSADVKLDDVAFIRFSVHEFNSNSIVTVDEVIE